MTESFTLGLIVSNHYGVLNRISGMFAKRCYNIDSLAVGATNNKNISRMTIVCQGNDYIKEQVVKQLQKLHDVYLVEVFDEENSVNVENLLVKFHVEKTNKNQITQLINNYGAKVMDFSDKSITVEVAAPSARINKFIQQAEPIGILELCRSGQIAMSHGIKNMLSL